MKAMVLSEYGSTGVLRLQDAPKPSPQRNEVLVKVHAASVNDWDWCIMRGTPFYIRLLCGLFKPKVQILGVDVAGRVEAVGEDVTEFKPGDEVYGDLSECGFGGFAEYVCAQEKALAVKPAAMSFEEAAAMPHAAMLAVQGLRDDGCIQAGQTVLINGAGGGVGTLALQIARSFGVDHVTGIDSAEKLDMMRSLGFDRVVDYRLEDFTKSRERYDLILDTKTNRSLFKCLRALTPEGTYVTIGGTTIRLFQAFFIGPILRAFTKKKVRLVALKPNKDLDFLSQLYEAGKIRPVIDGPYPLSHLPQAIQRFGNGEHLGKILISV